MTAICGWLWSPKDIREHNCRKALARLGAYGAGAPQIRSFEHASFGIDLRHLLPEDDFDTQPLQFGIYLLVADIRIDNRHDLARALNVASHRLTAMADAELLAQAWAKWQSEAFAHVIGDYAAAVYSSSDDAVWLARSIGGNRPLFYHHEGGECAFSSMPSALWCDPTIARAIDMKRIARGLAGLLPDEDEQSYLAGIRRVLPGQLVRLDRDGRTRSSFPWEPSFQRLNLSSNGEYAEAFRAVLEAAVRPRLRARSTMVATQLSAGFDSNAVTATAAGCCPGKGLIALTAAPLVGYDGPTHAGKLADESPIAALTAIKHGIEHVVAHGCGDPLAHLGPRSASYEDPFRNILNASWDRQLRSLAAERGAGVLLTGELGNLTLTAGGAYVLGDLIAEGAWQRWVHQALKARSLISARAIIANSFERWIPPSLMSSLERLIHGTPWWWDVTFLRPEWHGALRDSGPTKRRRNSYEERWDAIRTFDSGTVRKGSLAETPVDTRDPLIDRRIIDFSLSLPPEQLFFDGRSSPLAITGLSDRVPSAILGKRIRGHQSADWHERIQPSRLLGLTEEIAAVPGVADLIDLAELRRAIGNWPPRDVGSSRIVSRYSTYLPMTLAAGLYLRDLNTKARE